MSCFSFTYGITSNFKKEYKKLQKKYKGINADFKELVGEIKTNPHLGTDLGSDLRKVRMKITAKNKGKSSGARVVYEDIIINRDRDILFVTIYDKSDVSNISVNELKSIIRKHNKNTEE